ncbi:UBC-like protein [Phellopilus nigrolimitatus]|nr:UBC-like protein [Phellopilus nigrolimitatus]
MSGISTRRLQKELKEIHNDCPQGIKLVKADDFETWILSLEVLGESLYVGETFMLRFRFDTQYPISSPSVTFVVDQQHQAPLHPHVYSNGHICANILGDGWSPVLSVTSVCISLQSMLASCQKKERPEGNDRYVMFAPDDPKKSRFMYDGMTSLFLSRGLNSSHHIRSHVDDSV